MMPFHYTLRNSHYTNRHGVTLIEVLMATVISAIAMFALVPPFIAEGNFFRKGKRQTEAQRDAQLVMRTIARVARQSSAYTTPVPGQINLTAPCGVVTFEVHAGGALHKHGCDGELVLIDGVRSRVTSFTITPVVSNRLVLLQLVVTHRLQTTDPQTSQEILETELFLRNGA